MDFDDRTACMTCGKREPCSCDTTLLVSPHKHTPYSDNRRYTLLRTLLYKGIKVFL